jgi:hypothetical protein
MPRKKSVTAEAEFDSDRKIHLRFLLRSPEFRRDFRELQAAVRIPPGVAAKDVNVPPDFFSRLEEFLKQWNLYQSEMTGILFPSEEVLAAENIVQLDPLSTENIPIVERLLAHTTYSPVSWRTSEPGRVEMSVDLDAVPLDSLIAMVEDELRKVYRDHKQRTRRVGTRVRRRPDTDQFDLRVFDLALQGERSFRKIATQLSRPPSSVKTAFMRAAARIGVPRTTSRRRAASYHDWDVFDPDSHKRTCVHCRGAKTVEEMCAPLRQYVKQDERGQSEKLLRRPITRRI